MAGKVTVFDFWAEWCGPCRATDERLLEWLAEDDRLAVRKLNVVDWSSEVAQTFLARASGLPYLEVWTESTRPNGKSVVRKIGTVDGFDLAKLENLIKKGRSGLTP